MRANEMRRIKVIFLGPIQSLTKNSEDQIVLPEKVATIRGLVDVLAEKYGTALSGLILHGARSNRGICIFVNGENITADRDLDTVLLDGSEVEMVLASQAPGG